eukprot:1157787-Pelagomonas_calceolata.AAC.3
MSDLMLRTTVYPRSAAKHALSHELLQVDIWSLGCILAELSSGQVLFQNDSLATLLARLEGILGPVPEWMVQKGRYASRFYTRRAWLTSQDWDAPAKLATAYTLLFDHQNSIPDHNTKLNGCWWFGVLVLNVIAKQWSEKNQWLVRYKIPAISRGEIQQTGCLKGQI